MDQGKGKRFRKPCGLQKDAGETVMRIGKGNGRGLARRGSAMIKRSLIPAGDGRGQDPGIRGMKIRGMNIQGREKCGNIPGQQHATAAGGLACLCQGRERCHARA